MNFVQLQAHNELHFCICIWQMAHSSVACLPVALLRTISDFGQLWISSNFNDIILVHQGWGEYYSGNRLDQNDKHEYSESIVLEYWFSSTRTRMFSTRSSPAVHHVAKPQSGEPKLSA